MKIFQNEKETHSFLALLVIGSVVIGMFTLMFNTYNPLPCSDMAPCGYQGLNNITIVNTDPIVVPSIPKTTDAYKKYAETHVWSTTTPKTTWEKNDYLSYGAADNKCFIASTTVLISISTSKYKELSFNQALCPNNSPIFYPGIDGNRVYVNWNSEDNVSNYSNGSPAFRYWILGNNESPQSFISKLVQSLSDPEQRDHCKVDSAKVTDAKTPKGDLAHYTVSPDVEYIKMKSDRGEQSYASCYPYSNYFQSVGNLLVYIENSQDLSLFDPDSMKLSEEKEYSSRMTY